MVNLPVLGAQIHAVFWLNNFEQRFRHENSCGCVQNLEQAFPVIAITHTMDAPQSVRVVDGHPLQITEILCPVCFALHTISGLVTRHPLALTAMLGTDDVLVCSIAAPGKSLLGLS